MIEVSQLTKTYGAITALDAVEFRIEQGDIVGLLGPNGAGKTTLIKIMTGYLHPDDGTVRISDIDVMDDPLAVQTRIGYLPENAPLYPELTVQGYLLLMADLHRMERDRHVDAVLEAAEATGLTDRLTQKIGTLSKGYRQRVGIAQAIMHKPDLLIFDEPSVGLDPTQIIEIRSLIRSLAEHSTIIFSTHILAEVEALCDRVLILLNGKLRSNARLDELQGATDVVLVLDRDESDLKPILARHPAIGEVHRMPGANGQARYRITADDAQEVSPLVYQTAAKAGWAVRELYCETASLESTFNDLALRN